MTHWLKGLADIAERYDGFIIDQFGVLHDGVMAYPGAAQALHELRQCDKKVVICSNSGKRAAANALRLRHFGVTNSHYDAVVTSGELLWQMLRARDRAPFDTACQKLWLGHPQEDLATLAALNVTPVTDLHEADALLLASLPDQADAAARLQPALDQGLARRLPLICANPDFERLTSRGIEPSTGALARHYERAGGQVIWLDKPHPLIYAACHQWMNSWGRRHVLMVGDSLNHNVAGGARAGCDTCFIAAGLHRSIFSGQQPKRCKTLLQALLHTPDCHGVPEPNWALPSLRWD